MVDVAFGELVGLLHHEGRHALVIVQLVVLEHELQRVALVHSDQMLRAQQNVRQLQIQLFIVVLVF